MTKPPRRRSRKRKSTPCHILVPTEEEAKNVEKRLKAGEDFGKLADQLSKDPGSKGGDLGWFTKDRMVPEFAEVAFNLQPGQVSAAGEDPVRLARHQGAGKARRSLSRRWIRSRTSSSRFVAQSAQSEAIMKLREGAKITRSRPARRRRRATGRDEKVRRVGDATSPASAGFFAQASCGWRMTAAGIAALRRQSDLTPAPKATTRARSQITESNALSYFIVLTHILVRKRLSTFRRICSNPRDPHRKVQPMAAAKISPLAPKTIRRTAADRRRAPRRWRRRHPLHGPHRRDAGGVRQGRDGRGVFTTSKCPSAPVDWCRAKLPAARPAPWWSIPATPTPSPARAAAQAAELTAKLAAKATGAPTRTRFFWPRPG